MSLAAIGVGTRAIQLVLVWALTQNPARPARPTLPLHQAELIRLYQAGLARLTNAVPSDDEEGFAMLLRAANGGLAEAQYDVAISYQSGNGVGRRFDERGRVAPARRCSGNVGRRVQAGELLPSRQRRRDGSAEGVLLVPACRDTILRSRPSPPRRTCPWTWRSRTTTPAKARGVPTSAW